MNIKKLFFFIGFLLLYQTSIAQVEPETSLRTCTDGIDNDGDGLIDCDDPECVENGVSNCRPCFNDLLAFADTIEMSIQTCPDSNNLYTDFLQALGRFDFDGFHDSAKFVSIGTGGSLQFGFQDNLIANSGDTLADLWVYEVGLDREGVSLSLRPYDVYTESVLNNSGISDLDGDGFWEFGEIDGGRTSFDIDRNFIDSFERNRLLFDGVRIVDIINSTCAGTTPGADIDAICGTSQYYLEQCFNGLDDDNDGFIDEDDADCSCEFSTDIQVLLEGNICREGLYLRSNLDENLFDFQWMKDGFELDGDTSSVLLVTGSVGYYELLVNNGDACFRSEQILVEIPFSITHLEQSICAFDAFFYENEALTESGIYNFHLISEETGCDSIIELNLNVRDPAVKIVNRTICEGDSVFFNGMTIRDPGQYNYQTVNLFGCDSMVLLTVQVEPIPEREYSFVICEGDTIEFRNSIYTEEGSFVQNVPVIGSCDSMLIVNIEKIFNSILDTSVFLCPGDVTIIGGQVYTQEGTYEHIIPAASGCDSILLITVNQITNSSSSLDIDICNGDSITINNETYYSGGLYEQIVVASNGCDSLININIVSMDNDTTRFDYSICEGDSVLFNGIIIQDPGQYNYQTVNSFGCDSTVLLTVQVKPIPEREYSFVICEGDTIEFRNSIYTEEGSFVQNVPVIGSCDSMLIVNIEKIFNSILDTSVFLCPGDVTIIGGQVYTQEGIYEHIIPAASGCDSILLITVNQITNSSSSLDIDICNGDSITINNETYNSGGLYEQIVVASNGCDSLININIVSMDNDLTRFEYFICEDEIVFFRGMSFSEYGIFEFDTIGPNNCLAKHILSIRPKENCEQCISSGVKVNKLKFEVEKISDEWYKFKSGYFNQEDSERIVSKIEMERLVTILLVSDILETNAERAIANRIIEYSIVNTEVSFLEKLRSELNMDNSSYYKMKKNIDKEITQIQAMNDGTCYSKFE